MTLNRRVLLAAGAAAAAAPAGPVLAQGAAAPWPLLRPPRLKPGDTIGLINPSGAIHERQPYEVTTETLQALGFKVREAPNLRARYGHQAGTAEQRASDVHAMFADPGVHGLLAVTGGSGGNRVLPLLDYAAIRRTPKVLAGFSDVTALINAVHARTGLVTFHAPVGVSEWNAFSVEHLLGAVVEGRALTLRNQPDKSDGLVPKEHRITTLRGGTARGPLVGGNLAVLTSMAGSPYLPSFDGAILFLEEINEYIYRVDRMLSTLKLMGALDRVAGVVIGAFTNCNPGEGYGTLTLDEVFDDWFRPLKVPVYRGAMIGHIKRKFTVPVGLPAEIDADAGTIRFLSPAVA
ncbi:LD-carboxypeptidase [Ideonella sp. A 288]|uniref:S66 peptidase family protein n=1 Tax=Ideonella sp. A 288 TaxID=1962181 RepID=UPI000B4C024F|nr:LD-carboxypeptidase [Ideonella sp. A 288]